MTIVLLPFALIGVIGMIDVLKFGGKIGVTVSRWLGRA